MKLPKRIQRSRAKGSKLPPRTRCIGRETKYGNPFWVLEHGRVGALDLYRRWLRQSRDGRECVATARREFVHFDYIACWCSVDQACHGDVLLEEIRRR